MLWRGGSHFAAPPPPSAELPNLDYEARLVAHLRKVIANAGTALAGRVNLLSLSHVKEHFGPSWPRVAERAERIARSAIEHNLSPGDIYAKWDDFDFLLMFAELSAEAAQVKCAVLAEQIARELVGEEGEKLIAVKTAILRRDGDLDFENVPVKTALSQLIQDTAAIGEAGSAGAGTCEGAAQNAPDPGPQWQELITTRALRTNPQVPPSLDEELAGLRVRFRPIWDATHRNAVLNQCVPLLMAPESEEVCWPAEFVIGNDAAALARIDIATRQAAMASIARLVRQDQRVLLTVPVHFDTLGKLAARLDYIRALDRLSAVEQRLLLFELLGVPRGVLQARLLELILPLRARVYGVIARVDLNWRDFTPIAANGLRAVGLDVGAYIGPEEMLCDELLRFERNARKAGLFVYVHGVRSRYMINALHGAIAYMSGDVIAPLRAAPVRIEGLDFTAR
jgi:hypothetical protein